MDAESTIKSDQEISDDKYIQKMVDGVVNAPQSQAVDSGATENPGESENPLVNEAFEHLKEIFLRNFHNAMVEAGRYIIDHFYEGDYRAALAKNKTKDQPPNLKALINKIRQAPTATEDGVPSIGWFYNAVNLAAHEYYCTHEGLQTFGMLGHSHKLQLLHTPKLKSIQVDEIEETIESAFVEKERLAKYAYENALSVRDFKKYINEQHPSNDSDIDLTALPPKPELRQKESNELVKLWNMAKTKFENGQQQVSTYRAAMQKLEIVLAETGSIQSTGGGRFQDWTNPKNNVNFCVGCKNDCVYCYMKSMNFGRQKAKQPGDWVNWEIRQKAVDAPQQLRDGLVGFPSSHDIFPEILDDYLFVLGKLLRAGNEVLIVTKPNIKCISAICSASQFFTDKIIFRFTIGAMNDAILKIWEPSAPCYEERKACLEYAFNQGFRTSVSMEPALEIPNIDRLIEDVRPFVNTDIWLGTMNHIDSIKKWTDESFSKEIERIKSGQSPEILTRLYLKYIDDPLIKWKTDAFKIIEKAMKKKFNGKDKIKIEDHAGVEKEAATPVIISASSRTDIPAFFTDSFIDQWEKGFFVSVNRYGLKEYISTQNARVVVFWTKNPAPLLRRIDDLSSLGVNYYFQFTLNDYEEEGFESNVPPLEDRIETFINLSKSIGKERIIWRFDPLIVTGSMDAEKLMRKVSGLAEQVAPYTEKLVVSLSSLNEHKNVKRKLEEVGIRDFSENEIEFIASQLLELGQRFNIDVVACREESLTKYGLNSNKCIDDGLMRRAFSEDTKLMAFLGDGQGLKNKGQIKSCGCIMNKDIGQFNTCHHFCVYCYANSSGNAVKKKIEMAKEGRIFMVPNQLEVQ